MTAKTLVTGVTGSIGKATVEQLLKKGVPASDIIGLSRKKEGLNDLTAAGVEIRSGDYFDYDSLVSAFEGVDKLMLTSSVAFTDRFTQHFNAITAARQAGVRQVVYMPIMRKEGSGRIMPEVTESDLFTEQVLKSSGLAYTLLYHPPFMDTLSLFYDPNPFENGLKVPANKGRIAAATRNELAEAHAEVLSTPGHENKVYSLGGSSTVSFSEIAEILADTNKRPVPFTTVTREEYLEGIVAGGLPVNVAGFLTSWIVAMEEGEFEYRSGDLERLLGRKSMSYKDYVKPVADPS